MAITWMSNYYILFLGMRHLQLFVTGYLHHSHLSYMHFNGFLYCFLQFFKVREVVTDFVVEEKFLKNFSILKFVVDMFNY